MSSFLGLIGPEHLDSFVLEREKIATFDFVYTITSTNINQSALNLVKMYITITSRMSSIMGLIGLEQLDLFTLELEKMLN